MPSEPTTYDVTVSQVYKDIYEEECTQWEINTKLVQENYDKEMEAYSVKGTGAMLLERALLDEKGPTLQLPTKRGAEGTAEGLDTFSEEQR